MVKSLQGIFNWSIKSGFSTDPKFNIDRIYLVLEPQMLYSFPPATVGLEHFDKTNLSSFSPLFDAAKEKK